MTDSAEAATSPPARTRWVVRLIGLAIVVALTVAIVPVLHWRQSVDVSRQAEKVLELLSTGHSDEVYAAAGKRFRREVSAHELATLAGDTQRLMGRFRDLRDPHTASHQTAPAGETARMAATARFERGSAPVDLSFQRAGGTWKLVGLRVELSEAQGRALDQIIAAEGGGEPVSPPLADLTRRFVAALAGDDLDAALALGSPVFRAAVTRGELASLVASRTQRFGALTGDVAVSSAMESRRGERAAVDATVQHERAAAALHLDLERIADGSWRIRTLHWGLVPAARDEP